MSPVLASIGAFLRNCVHPETAFARRVRAVLLLKLMILVALKVAFFSGAHKPADTEVAARFIGTDPYMGRMIGHD